MVNVEQWKPVVGFEKFYSVSNFGRVRSERDRQHLAPNKILRQTKNSDGYATVWINSGKAGRMKKVSRLVAEAFIGQLPATMQVNHKNGIRDDNRVENLEIISQQANIHHAIEVLGRDYSGENSNFAKLSEQEVIKLRQQYTHGDSILKLMRDFKISEATVRGIITGRYWKKTDGPIRKAKKRVSKEAVQAAIISIQAGKSVCALANELSVSPTTIRNWFRGKHRRLG